MTDVGGIAAAFHDFSVTLLPYGLTPEETNSLLSQANVDILVAEAGTLPLDGVLSASKSIKDIVLVAKGDGKHMDWDEQAPQGAKVSTWDQITSAGSKEVPPLDKETKVRPLSIFSAGAGGKYELVEFTSDNVISGVAGLSATIARDNKLGPSDILLPKSPLTDSYTLCWTLAGLYANASIALNSVAGPDVDLAKGTFRIKPTIIVAAPGTIDKYVKETIKAGFVPGFIARYFADGSLKGGIMPKGRPSVAPGSLSSLRLLMIGQPVSDRTRLSSSTLNELRLLLGAKVGYALTASKVAGAICQTNVHDYRNKGEAMNVGGPLGSVEIHMTGREEQLDSSTPQGKLTVKGPPVSGGKVEVDVAAQVEQDGTVRLL